MLRKSSCLLRFFRSAISTGSSKDLSALTFIEVPKGRIVHQRFLMEHWSREPGLGLGLNVYFLLLTLRCNP